MEEMTTLSSGRDPTFGPSSHQSEALPLRDWVPGRCPSPSSYFRLSHLVVLGFLPASCAISANLAAPCLQSLRGQPGARAGGVWGQGVKLPSLSSALVLLAVWMVLPSPVPCLWAHLSVFLLLFFLYIKTPGPIPTPHPHPALRLIYLSL